MHKLIQCTAKALYRPYHNPSTLNPKPSTPLLLVACTMKQLLFFYLGSRWKELGKLDFYLCKGFRV